MCSSTLAWHFNLSISFCFFCSLVCVQQTTTASFKLIRYANHFCFTRGFTFRKINDKNAIKLFSNNLFSWQLVPRKSSSLYHYIFRIVSLAHTLTHHDTKSGLWPIKTDKKFRIFYFIRNLYSTPSLSIHIYLHRSIVIIDAIILFKIAYCRRRLWLAIRFSFQGNQSLWCRQSFFYSLADGIFRHRNVLFDKIKLLLLLWFVYIILLFSSFGLTTVNLLWFVFQLMQITCIENTLMELFAKLNAILYLFLLIKSSKLFIHTIPKHFSNSKCEKIFRWKITELSQTFWYKQ